jgi:gamma-glutamyl-gamma-aminobutyrate hydrolase PuuD/uncharacterized protein YjbI with pentapeptide repeats
MNSISSNNGKIQYFFCNLDSGKKDALVAELDSNHRYALYKIFESKNDSSINAETQEYLLKKINEANQISLPVTLSDTKISWISRLLKVISTCLSDLAFCFYYLTAEKTTRLISSILLTRYETVPNQNFASLDDLEQIINSNKEALETHEISLDVLLRENGFSNYLLEINFDSSFSFKNLSLEDIEFIDCNFESCHFSNSNLSNCSFESCRFSLCSFMKANLDCVTINDSSLRSCMFVDASLNEVHIVRSTLFGSSFEDASLESSNFINTTMPGTHFLQATINNCKIIESDLKDCEFFDSFEGFYCDDDSEATKFFTKPTTAILVHPESRGITTPKAYMKLEQNANTTPLRISFNVPKANKDKVNKEVSLLLEQSDYEEDGSSLSLSEHLVKTIKENPKGSNESYSIIEKAKIISKHTDCIFLPGGEDIPPALYGQEAHEKCQWSNDYRRSLLELCLIHESVTKGIPLMAVCRGFQIVNVYFGAKLNQHIEGHDGFERLKHLDGVTPAFSIENLNSGLMVTSSHHQGIEFSSLNLRKFALEPLSVSRNIVKSAELKAGSASPMILLQFHPEWYDAPTADSLGGELIDFVSTFMMDNENECFWDILQDCVKKQHLQRMVISEIKQHRYNEELRDFNIEVPKTC